MGACARHDLTIGVDEGIGFARQRRDLDREGAFEPLRRPRADSGKIVGNTFEGRQAETNLEGCGQQQHNAQHRESDDESPVEAACFLIDLGRVAGDCNEVTALLAQVDRAFNDTQLLALGPFGVTLPRGARCRRGAEVGEVRQRCIPQRAGRSHVGCRRVEPRHLPVPAGERQIEQRLADRLGKLAAILLRGRDVGDQGPQIDAQPSVERTLHSRAIDRRQHDAGDDEDHHGPSRCREEQPKGERIKTHCPVERGDSQARARSV